MALNLQGLNSQFRGPGAFTQIGAAQEEGPRRAITPDRTAASQDPNQLPLGPSFFRGQVTRGQLANVGDQARRLGGLRTQVNASIDNAPDREGRRIKNVASQVVQQQFGDQQTGAVTHASVLDNALKRAKARTGIAQRGDAAVRNQQLKDRLTQVRQGITQKGRALDLQTKGQEILSGVNVAASSARSQGQAAVAGGLGTVVGALAARFGKTD